MSRVYPTPLTLRRAMWRRHWPAGHRRRLLAAATPCPRQEPARIPAPRTLAGNAVYLLALMALTLHAQDYTLGVGVYPGDPKENFAPAMRIDTATYRNLALHRPAYHSSSYDYNLTAQLITDGIKETALPRWISTSTSQGGVFK